MFPSAAAAFLAALAVPGTAATPPPQDIRGIVPPEPYYIATSPLWLLIVAVCVVLAGVAVWYLFFRHGAAKPGPKITPRERAEGRLRELATRMGELDARGFGDEVADVLREYVGEQFGLHPKRQTSPEFLASVQGSRVFTKTEHVLLADFLEGCDLLKFARADAGMERRHQLLTQATDFVRSSTPGEGGSQTAEVSSSVSAHS